MTDVLAPTQAALVKDRLDALTNGIGQRLLGKERQIKLFVATLISGGHVLLVDEPGVGKTTLAKGFAGCVSGSFARVQGTSDLLPTDLTGVSVYDQRTTEWTFHPGPLSHHVVLVDEINRIPARTQSALLEALAENQVTVDGTTHPVPAPFSVVATANPGNDIGTFPVVGGLMDRFSVSISLGLPSRESERAVALGLAGDHRPTSPVIGLSDLEALRSITNTVILVEPVLDYCLDIVDSVRRHGWLSPRASQSLVQTAKGSALLDGRNHVTPDDVRAVAPYVLAHRLAGSLGSQMNEQHQHVERIIADLPVPVPGR